MNGSGWTLQIGCTCYIHLSASESAPRCMMLHVLHFKSCTGLSIPHAKWQRTKVGCTCTPNTLAVQLERLGAGVNRSVPLIIQILKESRLLFRIACISTSLCFVIDQWIDGWIDEASFSLTRSCCALEAPVACFRCQRKCS